MPMIKHVVIVAGGKGKRMKSSVPKQFMLLNGKPVLMHTIMLFQDLVYQGGKIVVVLPKNLLAEWKNLCEDFSFSIPHTAVAGGKERFFSVKNGLETLDSGDVVAIHDGVRAGAAPGVIENCFRVASEKGSAIPVVPVDESMRKIHGQYSQPVNRSEYLLVQTPQTFRLNEIKLAYEHPYSPEFTDDASVYEASGKKAHLVEGNKDNIKITGPTDLAFMQCLKKQKS